MSPLPDRVRDIDRPLAGILVLQAAIVAAMTAAPEEFLVKKITDDSFYFYETARHMAAGDGMTFDGIHPTNGMQVIWVLILTPIYWLFDGLWLPVRVSIVIQGIAALVATGLFYDALRRLFDRSVAMVATVVWVFNPFVVFMYLGGHESSLNFLFLTGVLWLLTTRTRDERSLAVIGLVLGLSMMARLDNVLFVGIVSGALLGRRVLDTPRRFLTFSVSAGVIPAAYALYNFSTYGHLVPVSGSVLSTASTEVIVLYVVGCGVLAVVLAFLTTGVAPSSPNRAVFDTPTIVGLFGLCGVSHLTYYLLLHRTFRSWYFAMEAIAGALVGAAVLSVLLSLSTARVPRARPQYIAVALVVLLLGSFTVLGAATQLDPDQDQLGALHYDQARYLSNNVACDAVIGSGNAGILGYFSERSVVELNGLANSYEFVERYQGNHSKYIREAHPDFLVDYRPHVEHETLNETGYTRIRTISRVTEVQSLLSPSTLVSPGQRRFVHEVWMAPDAQLVSDPSC